MARVLVTGANGFVGRHLCRVLRASGFYVVGSVRSENVQLPNVDDVLVTASLGDDFDWSGVLSDIDIVVHLAARVHVMKDRAADPLKAFRRHNTAGAVRIADAAIEAGVKRFVFVSTVKVNGEVTTDRPFRFSDNVNPVDPYAISKYEAEVNLIRAAAGTGMDVVVIRPPLVYGPGVGGNFLRMLNVAASGVFLPFASIQNQRSMISVENLCDAIFHAIIAENVGGETFLVSDGLDISTSQLIELIRQKMMLPCRLFRVPISTLRTLAKITGKTNEVARLTESLQVDIGHTVERLDWQPPVPLDKGIADVVGWYNKLPGK